MTIFAALFTGFVIGLVLAAPAIVVEIVRPTIKNLPILIDVEIFRGRKVSRTEELIFSHALHLFMSTIFGVGYLLLSRIAAAPFDFTGFSYILYVVVFYLVVGGLLFPLLGLGVFGKHEGKYVPLELLMAHSLYGFCFYLAVNLFFLR